MGCKYPVLMKFKWLVAWVIIIIPLNVKLIINAFNISYITCNQCSSTFNYDSNLYIYVCTIPETGTAFNNSYYIRVNSFVIKAVVLLCRFHH